ncbi:tryptophan synthase subunit alpha [Calycomorphotria hydatis]|uniref:Tryptophan synthase alpha chain n=1 Tax=Calycomorphotria hydatis TaxID=2528027 RepID=A0A517TBN6_9PLAN|nr:tryptophan synthase subunit alpha [Calycomorphotria hydatis]QDT65792.1 Tryptophan synthase alpha chain [Calycomorphotria hydatis]
MEATETLIAEKFAKAREESRLAFMPFITAGDPDIATTMQVVKELDRLDVDLIEVGFPYSDPIADGPVIQASYFRALEHGLAIDQIFDAFAEVKDEIKPARVAMASFSLVYRYGAEKFLKRAKEAGFSGLITPDLPGDEGQDFAKQVIASGLAPIQLISPLTPPARAEKILTGCGGFVYCIAVAGVTGERESLPTQLVDHLKSLHEKTELPLAVGFGISRPDQVKMLKEHADGIIVGSAIVRQFEKFSEPDTDKDKIIGEITEYCASMVAACREN